ncbi:MAG: hypothetical protein NVSMB45_19420 [Ginsengibacter sp.]
MNLEKQLDDLNSSMKKDSVKDTLSKLPVIQEQESAKICNFQGYDVEDLMKETSQLKPVRYLTFRNTMKGFSSKTLAIRLKELEKNGILSRHAYNEIPPRVEYRLTCKGQELTESIIYLLQWMKKWSLNNL